LNIYFSVVLIYPMISQSFLMNVALKVDLSADFVTLKNYLIFMVTILKQSCSDGRMQLLGNHS
jgi:hypothetical protein